jgi:hypothetical protein
MSTASRSASAKTGRGAPKKENGRRSARFQAAADAPPYSTQLD